MTPRPSVSAFIICSWLSTAIGLAQPCSPGPAMSAAPVYDQHSCLMIGLQVTYCTYSRCGAPGSPGIRVAAFRDAPSSVPGTPCIPTGFGCDTGGCDPYNAPQNCGVTRTDFLPLGIPDSWRGSTVFLETWFGEYPCQGGVPLGAFPASTQLTNAPVTFTISYETSIPCPLVGSNLLLLGSPYLAFKGDAGAGTHRSFQQIRVTIDPSTGAISSLPAVADLGTTCGYYPWQVRRSANGVCGWTIVDDHPDCVQASPSDPSQTLTMTPEQLPNNTFRLHIVLHATNPLARINCSIDAVYYVDIAVRCGGGLTGYRLNGFHNGYPAHRLTINGAEVYTFDPRANGPLSLCLPQIPVHTRWRELSH